MSSIASLLTGGSAVTAPGNRGKASSNSQGDGEAFAKQLSENKTSKGNSSQKAQNIPIKTGENGAVVDVDLSSISSQFANKITLDYEFKSSSYPASVDVELNFDEIELSSDVDMVNISDTLAIRSPEEILVLAKDLSTDVDVDILATDVDVDILATDVDVDILATDVDVDILATNVEVDILATDVDANILATDVDTVPVDQGILAALNTQLSSNKQAAENNLTKKASSNDANTKAILPDKNSTLNSLVTQMGVAPKSENANIIDSNKVNIKGIDTGVVSSAVQNIDVSKANNTQNIETEKLPTNTSILANLANGDGLADKGADQQRDGSSHQFVNQVDKAGIKVEGVDVLEARVFPAISQSNGTNITDALLKTSRLGGNTSLQNTDPIYNISQPKTMNTLKIQLVPANLGVVTAVMKLTGEELQVQLQVDNIEAYRKLSSDSASIVNTLKNQGFGIEQVNVQLVNGDKGSVQQGQQQNGQSFQDQAHQEASSSFDRDRRDSNSTNSNEQNQELGNDESDVLQVPKVTDLSNGVYL